MMIRKIYIATCTVLFAFTGICHAQVANDDCVNAAPITLDALGNACITGTTTNALGVTYTSHPCWPTGQDIPEVWYSFVTTGTDNTITVTPTGATPAQQLGVTVMSAGCGGALNNCGLASSNGAAATTSWTYGVGTTVWINVGSIAAQGSFQLCITSTTPPATPGSSCATATTLCNKNPFSVASFPNNSNALQPSCFPTTFQRPVFYQFTVGNSGTCGWQANPTGPAEFDWVMYDITGGCPNNASPTFNCNFNFDFENGDPVGMQAGAPNTCPNDGSVTSGAATEFCPLQNVISGRTYMIIIDNWSDDNTGFDFSFGGTFTIAPQSQFTPSATTSCSPPLNVNFINSSVAAVSQTWNFGNGNTSTAVTPPTQTYTSSGTYIVSLTTTSATGCQNVTTSNLTIGSPPTVTVPSNTTVCIGSAVPAANFTSTPAGATYTWTNSNPAIGLGASGSANIPSFTATNSTGSPISGVISVTPTLNGCSGTPQSYTITVNPAPTLSVNSPTICSGAVTLIPSGATSYSWPVGVTPMGINNDSASVSPATTTSYVITGAVGTCTATTTATVTVTNNTTAPTTAPVTYCQGDAAAALTATPSAGGTLNWYGTNATGGTASATAPTPSTATVGTTTYYVSQAIGGCEGPRAPLAVTVNAVPNPPAAPNVVYCQNQAAAQLSATPSAGGTLNWYGTNATGGTASATAPTPNTATAGTTTYYVSQTVTGCESSRAPIIVTVNATPVAPATTNIGYCQNATAVSLDPNATASAGGTLNWYGTNATGGTASATAPTPSTATVGTTTYYVSQTIAGCEGPRAPVDVNIGPIPTNPITAPVTYCQNDPTAALTATPSAGGALNWYGTNSTGGTASATAPTPSSTTAGTTTYYVSQTVNGCESPREPLIVTVNATPAAPATSPVTYCQNVAAVALTASTSGGATLNWYGTNATGGTASATAPTPSTTTPGITTYYVSQTANSCESPRAPLDVTVNLMPTAPGTTPLSYCMNDNATVLTATTLPGASAGWYGTNATGGVASAVPPVVSTATAGTTTYYVSQTLTGCEGPRAPLAVTVYPLPTATLNPIASGCVPACRNFYLSYAGNLVSYYWNLGNGVVTNTDTIQNHCYTTAGVYTPSVFITDINGCSDTMHFPSISVYDNPIAEFTYGPETVTILEPEVVFNDLSVGTGIVSWTWQFGDPNNSTSAVVNPSFTYEEVGSYNVTLSVVNANGCTDTVTHPVVIPEDWAIYVPTAFSPNGDGVNEDFHPDGIGVDRKTYKMWIFDRWGNQIYYTQDWDSHWDGKVLGHSNLVQEDVYVWKIMARSIKGDKYSNTGHVTVVR